MICFLIKNREYGRGGESGIVFFPHLQKIFIDKFALISRLDFVAFGLFRIRHQHDKQNAKRSAVIILGIYAGEVENQGRGGEDDKGCAIKHHMDMKGDQFFQSKCVISQQAIGD